MSGSITPEVGAPVASEHLDSPISTPSNENSIAEIKNDELDQALDKEHKYDDAELKVLQDSLNSKGFSQFTGVVFLCLLISFGGFIFGFDTGTIGGFFNMGNFRKRFGSYHKGRKEFYFTNARTG